MHFSTFTDYSLRVVMYLGLRRERLTTISDIAHSYKISENHLMKVVHHLARLGFVETIRGNKGGMRLARAPENINLGELIRHTEGGGGLLPCLDTKSPCCIQPSCDMIRILREAQDALYAVLDRYSLADLLLNDAALSKILFHRDLRKVDVIVDPR